MRTALAGLATVLALTACSGTSDVTDPSPSGASTAGSPSTAPSSTPQTTTSSPAVVPKAKPLAGKLVVVDPGHQLGNHNFPAEIDAPVPAGGFDKPCNTTGTSTDAGYPEATFTWKVALRVRDRLERLGAKVMLTRHHNSQHLWGPCVDVRGRDGNKQHADLKLSIHGDGFYGHDAHGFEVIAPTNRRPWTHDIYRSSKAFALVVRHALHHAGFPYANYIAGGDGLDFRSDLATINLSNMPTVMVELGNMRDAGDARIMTSRRGQNHYAKALVAGIRAELTG